MPYGEHMATCMHCGRQYGTGDAITDTCQECHEVGHRGSGPGYGCQVCDNEATERRKRIDEAIAHCGT